MRTFTSTEQVNPSENVVQRYEGFNRAYQPVSEMDRVVIVLVDGEIELFVVDPGQKPLSELVRFLTEREEAGFGKSQIAGTYQRV